MIVIDTNVISEAMKPEPDEAVKGWLDRQHHATLFVTTVTYAEIEFGLNLIAKGARRDRLSTQFQTIRNTFQGRVLAFDEPAARRYAEIAAAARQSGRTIPHADAYLAGIAASHDYALATRNTSDFAATELQLINPWM